MFPLINMRETGINLRRIMDERGRRLYAYYEKLNTLHVA